MADLLSNEDVMGSLLRALCDPGQITDREPDESLQAWQRRAVIEFAAPYIQAAERKAVLGELLKRHRPVGSEWGHSCMTCWTRGGGRAAWPCAESLAIGTLLGEESGRGRD